MWAYTCKTKGFSPSVSSCYQVGKGRSSGSLMTRMAVPFYTHRLLTFIDRTELPSRGSAVILLNSYRS